MSCVYLQFSNTGVNIGCCLSNTDDSSVKEFLRSFGISRKSWPAEEFVNGLLDNILTMKKNRYTGDDMWLYLECSPTKQVIIGF